MGTNRNSLEIVEYWWLLELFSPQQVPKLTGRSKRPEGQQVVEWHPGDSFPWDELAPPKPLGKTRRKWRHTVYLGVYELEATYQRLRKAFGENNDAYDERGAGLSACAGVIVDEAGILQADSAILSSALWAVSKLTTGTPPHGTEWASGFTTAAENMVQGFDDLDGRRREKISSESPPPQDRESIYDLLTIAHAAAGVVGISDLASRRIIIQSDAVSTNNDDESTVGSDFLNSFFLDDLSRVHKDLTARGARGALADYLTSDSEVHVDARLDVMSNRPSLYNGVSVNQLPKGRWPSAPHHGLALRQQFAVNQALTKLAESNGMMGVNGPPGTGKTTMLRDVLAGNIVERARRLASLNHPNDAFTETTHRWTTTDGYPRKVRQLREDLTGFEMVVASANNAAVENVTTEIPGRTAIAEDWRADADYFADIATAVLKETTHGEESLESPAADNRSAAWGLIAAKLGNKSNRGMFRSEFWFDKIDPDTKKRKAGTAPRMQTRLLQWRDGKETRRPWRDAREMFWQAEKHVDDLVSVRQDAEQRLVRLDAAVKNKTAADKHTEVLKAEQTAAADAVHRHSGAVAHAEATFAHAEQDRNHHIATRPGVLETLLSLGRASREWRNALAPFDVAFYEAKQNLRSMLEHSEQLQSTATVLAEECARHEKVCEELSLELNALEIQISTDHDRFGTAHPYSGRHGLESELRTPWLDAEIDTARSELFLAALRLHEDFFAAAAGDMVAGLRGAVEVVAGAQPRTLESEKLRAAWQLFFLVVPMVSTTFASFGRMFAGLDRQSLGWVFIDEAGQACPQYAVGALWRARRAIVVGDPLQLQPVVSIPKKAASDIAVAFNVSERWIPPRASVQTLADRVSRYGTWLDQDGRAVWVSAPLTVHRRCDEPMFSLCNDIAYNGIMVNGVQEKRGADQFDGPSGPIIPTSRWLDEKAMTPGMHLQPNEIARLHRVIKNLMDMGISASDMIAISPFREVAAKLKQLGSDFPGLSGGTIHTAQGREADIVFLVLGGNPAAPGAKAWASSSVNLVNVAASRAKRRLYVIGDQSAWAKYNYFNQLSAALDGHSRA